MAGVLSLSTRDSVHAFVLDKNVVLHYLWILFGSNETRILLLAGRAPGYKHSKLDMVQIAIRSTAVSVDV